MQRYGIKTMSMGMLTTDDAPAVLRGPMVGKYLQMLIGGAEWGPLDYLVLDLPPGTGDTQLSLAQNFPLSGVVIVTTPQNVSLKIARRGLRMFERVQVPILGIIENMSGFTCPHCGKTTDVFRHGGGEQLSRAVGVPYLGAIPLDPDVVAGGDNGRPIVIDSPDSIAAQAYAHIAIQLADRLHSTPATVLKPFRWTWDNNEGAPLWMEGLASPSGARTTPIGLRRLNARTLSVLWADGRRDDLDVRDLRLACHCALCIEEMSGRKLLDPRRVGLDVSPRVITSIGNYAIGVDWSEGHNSGIYSFDYLRMLGEHNANAGAEHV
jgi:ATP-binding protein involved in chromosome partitioning